MMSVVPDYIIWFVVLIICLLFVSLLYVMEGIKRFRSCDSLYPKSNNDKCRVFVFFGKKPLPWKSGICGELTIRSETISLRTLNGEFTLDRPLVSAEFIWKTEVLKTLLPYVVISDGNVTLTLIVKDGVLDGDAKIKTQNLLKLLAGT